MTTVDQTASAATIKPLEMVSDDKNLLKQTESSGCCGGGSCGV
jgi:hypothetical protein